jgi:hypothetical protein
MTIKSKLIPFFSAGILVSSVAARAQTATNQDTGSSADAQAPESPPPTGSSTGPTGDTLPAAPSTPDPSSSDSASTPGTSSYGTTTSPQTNSPSSTDSSSTGMSPDAGTSPN